MKKSKEEKTKWMKSPEGLTYEEKLKALKLSFIEKRLRNDLVLIIKVIYNQIDLEATQLFKFFRKPELGRSSLRLLH